MRDEKQEETSYPQMRRICFSNLNYQIEVSSTYLGDDLQKIAAYALGVMRDMIKLEKDGFKED